MPSLKKPVVADLNAERFRPLSTPVRLWIIGGLFLAFLWSYWPVLLSLVDQWEKTPDYSHGYLVVPICAFMLWLKRDSLPESATSSLAWGGLLLLIIAGALRILGAYYYLEPVDGWSIPFWVGGAIWVVWGWPVFLWSAPALFFLFFMVPLPYSMESLLAQPLQSISTKMSAVILQSLLIPAVSESNTIVVGNQTLEVARACSGLRIFVGIAALAYVFLVMFKRPVWTRMLLLLAILPIALIANSMRIVSTGILYQFGLDETAKHLSHDIAGFVMIPLAASLFALFLAYLDRLFVPIQTIDATNLIRHQTGNV